MKVDDRRDADCRWYVAERVGLSLTSTTFYPCPDKREHQVLHAFNELRAIVRRGNPSRKRQAFAYAQGRHGSPYILVHFFDHVFSRHIQTLVTTGQAARKRVPSGTTSCSTYFQRATSNLRASATMPILRIRAPPCA